ncbi:MAG: SDR family oxidoreductase [Deltaproteobacteria bacterium]|nr:SDR family oxidoreductase [Deltaproteobacteria bacterium]
MKHVLVTGGGGYIGSTLTEVLLNRGYEVTVLDRFFFNNTLSDLENHKHLHLIKDDIRWCSENIFKNIDAVCDLAALSNDPAGELDPHITLDINFKGRERICKLAKKNGVQKYILASSCSIYGFQDSEVDEQSPINPLTTYAQANSLAEESTLSLGDQNYSVTSLRQATIYGLSRRMRFDLAINGMTLALFQSGVVKILKDGTQWRPMVHIRDTSHAFVTVLETENSIANQEIFNVGSNEQNLQILPLAHRIAQALNMPFQEEWYGEPDHRSYRVRFDKIKAKLNFQTSFTPENGAQEIFQALKMQKVKTDSTTRTVQWYQSLLKKENIFAKQNS